MKINASAVNGMVDSLALSLCVVLRFAALGSLLIKAPFQMALDRPALKAVP